MNIDSLKEFDSSLSNLAAAVFAAYRDQPWHRLRYVAKFTPTADVWAGDYDLIGEDGTVDQSTAPDTMNAYAIDKLSHRHWRLTQDLGQPRWYKMIASVERSGKFSVDFDYKDDYQEGDIMKRAAEHGNAAVAQRLGRSVVSFGIGKLAPRPESRAPSNP